VSQISPPVRVLLAGAIILLAAWFTVLRPKADTAVPPVATPVATATGTPTDGLGRAVAKAHGAAATEEAASKAHNGEAAQAQADTGTKAPQVREVPTVAIPANVLAKLPSDVVGALKAQDTIVLGVIADGATELRPLADDDRYVRNALSRVNTYEGQVLVKRVPVSELVNYAPLVGDLQVNQTPSIVVIDHKLRGTVLAGYVDRISINQAIADARADSVQSLIADPYLRKLSATCREWTTHEDRWSYPTIPGQKALKSSMDRRVRLENRYRAIFTDLAAPKRWRSLKAEFVAAMKSYDTSLARQAKAVKAHDHHAWVAATESFDTGRFTRLDARLDKLGVTGCVSNRRT
jgi:hypothetical protein